MVKKTYILFILLMLPISLFPKINVNKASTIHIESGSNFVAENQIEDFGGHLIVDDGVELSGENIIFNNGTYENNGNTAKLTGILNSSDLGEVILDGQQIFKGKRGTAVSKLKIKSANNRLEGFLQLDDKIELQDSSTSVTCAVQGRVPCNFEMNGGTIYLEEDLHFVDDVFLTGSGKVKLNRRKLKFGGKEMTCDASLYLDDAADIELGSNLHLAETWTFSGTNVLNGNGKILYLEDGGNIVLEKGSALLLQDVILRNVSGNKVRCLDSACTVSLQNVAWVQDGNYSFTIGGLEVIDSLTLSGKSTFAYQSAQTSTLWSYGKIIFDRGMTFSFDPIWNESFVMGETDEQDPWLEARNFLHFTDDTSLLELKGATLYVTTTGMKLTRGTFRIKEETRIVSELDGEFNIEEGLIIGNNNVDDDVLFEFGGGAVLEVVSGALSYKNVQDFSLNIFNDYSSLYITSDAKLKLHQTMNMDKGVVAFGDGARLARASGKSLLGAVHIFGSLYHEVCYN